MKTHSHHNRRTRLPRKLAVSSIALSALWAGTGHAQDRLETIAQTGQAAAGGNGTYSSLGSELLNSSGNVAFSSTLTGTSGGANDNSGIFIGNGSSASVAFREGQAIPVGPGTFGELSFTFLDFNDAGQVAVGLSLLGTSGGAADDTGIFRFNGGSITQIAREGQSAAGNGTFGNLTGLIPAIGGAGHVGFTANLNGTSGGTADNGGIFVANGISTQQIARRGQAAPDADGTLNNFGNLARVNNAGSTTFLANLTGTNSSGIFRGAGSTLTQSARAGQLAPGGSGTFNSISNVFESQNGLVVFSASLNGTSGGSSDNFGTFLHNGSSISEVVRRGQVAPDGNGTWDSAVPSLVSTSGNIGLYGRLSGTPSGANDNEGLFVKRGTEFLTVAREGQAAPNGGTFFKNVSAGDAFQLAQAMNASDNLLFIGNLAASPGGSITGSGLYVGDGADLIEIARTGQSTAVGTATSFSLSTRALNDYGQVAFKTNTTAGTSLIRLWTPELHWRSTSGGDWDDKQKWTLGLDPALVHDVAIDSAASVTVSGPAADTTVRSLKVGGGSGLATLSLNNGTTLTALNGATVASTGTLTGDGTIAGSVTNNGTVLAQNLTVTGTLANNLVMRGSGRVHSSIVNNAAGKIRALSGAEVWLSGPSFSNAGLVEVNSSELRIDSAVTNQASTGLISLRNGSLITDAGITNQGSLAATIGASTIQGDINNLAGGIVQVSGGAHATFFGDIVQNGVMQVSTVGNTASTAVILGGFTGAGGFIGGGDVFALGDLRPGNSPASVLFDGNLFLGTTTDTFIELGGLGAGDFDQLLVSGDLGLAGSLSVSLINGFQLADNMQFLIGDIGDDLTGQFNGLGEGSLIGTFGGRDLFISYSGGNGNDISFFTAVPEPGVAGLAVLALVVTVCSRRRRRELVA